MNDPSGSKRRSSVARSRPSVVWIGIGATFLVLVAVAAILPGPAARRSRQRAQRLTALDRVTAIPFAPATTMAWPDPAQTDERRLRAVTIHHFLKLGAIVSPSYSLPPISPSAEGPGQSAVHLIFDPRSQAQRDLATAISLDPPKIGGPCLLVDVLVNGSASPKDFAARARKILARHPAKMVAEREARLVRLVPELRAFGAAEFGYEAAGRCYRDLPKKPPRRGSPYTLNSIYEAMSDPQVLLP